MVLLGFPTVHYRYISKSSLLKLFPMHVSHSYRMWEFLNYLLLVNKSKHTQVQSSQQLTKLRQIQPRTKSRLYFLVACVLFQIISIAALSDEILAIPIDRNIRFQILSEKETDGTMEWHLKRKKPSNFKHFYCFQYGPICFRRGNWNKFHAGCIPPWFYCRHLHLVSFKVTVNNCNDESGLGQWKSLEELLKWDQETTVTTLFQ